MILLYRLYIYGQTNKHTQRSKVLIKTDMRHHQSCMNIKKFAGQTKLFHEFIAVGDGCEVLVTVPVLGICHEVF